MSVFLVLTVPFLFFGCSDYREIIGRHPGDLGNNRTQNISSPTQSLTNLEWRNAVFMTIRTGTDTRTKVLSVLGKPIWTGTPFDESGEAGVEKYLRDEFTIDDELFTKVAVVSFKDNGRVDYIEASVPNLPFDKVFDSFGRDFHRKLLSIDRCDPHDPKSEIYIEADEEHGGVYYLYPNLGIIVPMSYDDTVNTVLFVSESFASGMFKCKGN
ncbi:MAG: hypothetical protein KF881_07495 [Acidobacteria bacterium]|nr:hypothetical protein [Acidobacteriota bacterium]